MKTKKQKTKEFSEEKVKYYIIFFVFCIVYVLIINVENRCAAEYFCGYIF